MIIKSPSFWHRKTSYIALALLPLSYLYTIISQWLRSKQVPIKLPSLVISVGNLVMGGAGKTPVAVMLAQILQHQGRNVHFVTRGYGGTLKGPCQVNSMHHYRDVGDEPLMLSQVAPTWVAQNRVLGGQAAQEAGADVLILDDGHQHMSLIKDISLLVIDSEYGHGNGCVFPAGPLREPIEDGYIRADGLVLIGTKPFPFNNSCPSIRVDFTPYQEDLEALRGHTLVAFAGIGRPCKFFKMLKSYQKIYQFNLSQKIEYADHYSYTQRDTTDLQNKANQQGAILVTTEKDFMRWPSSEKIRIVRIKAQIIEGNWDQFWTQVTAKVKN